MSCKSLPGLRWHWIASAALLFIGSSPIRQYVEDWDLPLILKRSTDAIDVAVKAGLPVAFVTEDTTRSRPDVLTTLFRAAVDHGATRLCLSDTVGHATPDGVRNLVQFTKDWHGHNDRGFALENAIWALDFGADRVHATALGIGERVGNAQMELLLLNMKLLGQIDQDLTKLLRYVETVAKALDWTIPINYPLVGRDAFRTATGVHASAIIKALAKNDIFLADRIYSGVKLVQEILAEAKKLDRIMLDQEVLAVVEQSGIRVPSSPA